MKFLRKNIIGILVTLFFLLIVCVNLDFRAFLSVIRNFKIEYILLFVPVYVGNLVIKSIRWQVLMQDEKFNLISSFPVLSVGNILNITLPCRFGDFWRAYEAGKLLNESKVKIFGSILTERILDFLSIILLLIIIILRYLKTSLTMNLMYTALGILLLMIFVCYVLIFWAKKFQKIKFITDLVEGLKKAGSRRVLLLSFILSLIIRMFECIWVYIILLGAGLDIAMSSTVFVVVFNALAGILPSVSNYIGAYQYSYILALGIYGVSKSASLAVVTVYEFITLVILGFISFIYWARKVISKIIL